MNNLYCPSPINNNEIIQLSHGSGGKKSQLLLEQVILEELGTSNCAQHDSTILDPQKKIAFTTDSYVVNPIFFPGGNIGDLAVLGTANDLAMGGARPKWISLGLILEEGFSIEKLRLILRSIRSRAVECSLEIATGDTKVVERGKGDGVFINTSGIGELVSDSENSQVHPSSIQAGDVILVSGDIGRHGTTIMSYRKELNIHSSLQSDCANLFPLVNALLQSNCNIHCLRDITRGGLASCLNELANSSGFKFKIDSKAIPIAEEVIEISELLGIDPLHLACEGRFVTIIPQANEQIALEVLQKAGASPATIGKVEESTKSLVSIVSPYGTEKLLPMLSGEVLPRIC